MKNFNYQRGFTLVELVMVIVIMGVIGGIVSVFMKSPIDAYFASARRAALTDTADTTMRRMARDIQRALPNSIRTPSNQCVEFIPTKTGGRYRAEGVGALDFAAASTSFNMLGSNTTFAGGSIPADQQIGSGDVIVVYNLGIPDSDAYQQTGLVNTAAVQPTVAASGTVTSPEIIIPIASTQFPLASGSNRFHVVPSGVKNIVAYVCNSAKELHRTTRAFDPPGCATSGTCPATCPATGPILARNVSACNFDYSGSDLQRNALIRMTLQLTDAGEAVNLMHEVHVSNTP